MCLVRDRDLAVRPPVVPEGFWAHEDMVRALGTWHMGRVIAAYRNHPGHGRPLRQEVVAGWARTLDNPYAATATELLRETQGDVPMQRRSFLRLSGASATAPALDLLIAGAPVLQAAQDGDRVSPQLSGMVERTVRQARELDDSEGSASTFAVVRGSLAEPG